MFTTHYHVCHLVVYKKTHPYSVPVIDRNIQVREVIQWESGNINFPNSKDQRLICKKLNYVYFNNYISSHSNLSWYPYMWMFDAPHLREIINHPPNVSFNKQSIRRLNVSIKLYSSCLYATKHPGGFYQNTHAYTHTCMHTHTHARTHTYTHMCMHSCTLRSLK